MRKIITVVLVLGLLMVGTSQLAFAAGNGWSPQENRENCFLDLLSEENREQVESIMQDFYEKMMALREKMQEFRVTGERDNLQETRDEMWDMKEERRETIAPYLPEEYRDEYMSRDFERKNTYRPEDRSFGHMGNNGGSNNSRKGFSNGI